MLPTSRLNNIVYDMNTFGICVVDGFLGPARAESVRKEAIGILNENKHLFKNGQLINDTASRGGLVVRGDKIAWLDGSESFCSYTNNFTRSLDSVIAHCVANDATGELGLHKISRRTKAMLACYPGSGTRYFKHVDNPNFDGRKISCVYYLNKDWDVERDGGALRIYPEEHPDQMATVHPILDRLVLFWADRRNPHEVMPAARCRLSITLWYFDDNELAMQTCINSALQQRIQDMEPFSQRDEG
ncbi:egl nine homolog 1 [Galendromus occidentalis]|uniref:hypoxia-inducible factor-proline dioxygenase n=1 Tax=Galendromus occidentalis TaxID=34638 RepID=A0AAJ6VY46_9ACAR|nr:egl nine homolog 1 [Galendromus occidentalis]